MLISDSKSFIFIHNYKVAGNSIREALGDYSTPPLKRINWIDRQLEKIGLRKLPDFHRHMKAVEVRDVFPNAWNDYFTFGFVRNPWSWLVSLYSFMLENEDHRNHEFIKSLSGFEEYIEYKVCEARELQSEFFCDKNGNVIVDYVGRIEKAQKEFSKVCKRINVNESLPHKNKSTHQNYKKYYNRKTKSMVKKHFNKDIKKFGYDFGGIKGG